MFTKWKLSNQIAFAFGVAICVSIAASLLALAGMRSVAMDAQQTVESRLPLTQLSTEFQKDILTARINFIYFVTIQKPGTLEKGWDYYRDAQKALHDMQAQVAAHPVDDATRASVQEVSDAMVQYEPQLRKIIALAQAGSKGAEFDSNLAEWAKRGNVMTDAAARVQHSGDNATRTSCLATMTELRRKSWLSSIVAVGGLLCAVLVALATVLRMNRQLRRVTHEIQQGAQQLVSVSSQISSSAQSLAQGASEQAAFLQQTSASTTQISATTKQNAEHAGSAEDTVGHASTNLTSASGELSRMQEAMRGLAQSSSQVVKIVKVIDDIAFQTNILALNAAVEAARAGSSGMGFAVVADEVRSLSQRCAAAARETTELVEASVRETRQSDEKLNALAAALTTVVGDAETLKGAVERIASGSKEQSTGLEQIATAMSQMEHVTTTAAASAEQSAAAGEQLNAQAQTLNGVVSQLTALVEGAREAREVAFAG